jgi:hypothetical protein
VGGGKTEGCEAEIIVETTSSKKKVLDGDGLEAGCTNHCVKQTINLVISDVCIYCFILQGANEPIHRPSYETPKFGNLL